MDEPGVKCKALFDPGQPTALRTGYPKSMLSVDVAGPSM